MIKSHFKTGKSYRSKPKRYANKKHLVWVSELGCILQEYNKGRCADEIQVHHLLKPFFSLRGMSLKAGDKDVVPLCANCHRALHLNGNELKYFNEIASNQNIGQEKCLELWEGSPHYEK
tara:strand:+ start:311 stop:667 length:357 start_codon:yes stop_codon:yes gene_type:complete